MTIQELFAMNKETLFGPQPEDTKAVIGYNMVIRQVGALVDIAAEQLRDYGTLTVDVRTLIRLNRNFHKMDSLKMVGDIDPKIGDIINTANEKFCAYFDEVYATFDLKVT